MSQEIPVVDLQSGILKFNVVDAAGQRTPGEIDVMVLKLTCEELEQRHNLNIVDDKYVPTPQFLFDLSESLKTLGVPSCTPTMAMQLWIAAGAGMEDLKKNTGTLPT